MPVNAAIIAERRVIRRLMQANAVSAAQATPLEGLRFLEERRLQRLLNAGVVEQSQPGRYYLNIPALSDRLDVRRRRVGAVVAFVIILMGILLYMSSRHVVY